MDNPYELLGLKPSASVEDVRKAYRKLAKKCHPDLHPGDAEAEARFKAISQAQALLSDPEKRARFDAGEIDAAGNERAPEHFYHPHADSEDGVRYARYDGSAHPDSMSDIFAELFRNQQDRAHVKMRGHDIHYSIDIPFLEAGWIHISSATFMFSRKASAGVLNPRHFLGVELMAHVNSLMSSRV